jgi:outer membrane scaffolding protein for murein synthesis (MipA/OmpV family)
MPKVSALASKAPLVDPRRRRGAAGKAFGSMSEGILYTSLQYPKRYYGVSGLRCDDSKMRNFMAIWIRAVA